MSVTFARAVSEAAVIAYYRVAARKHGITVPMPDDLTAISDDELERLLLLVKDLAHLPPG